jgi:hypothetical protein
VRRGTVAAAVATVLLTATGCLTPLTSQQPLTPVPAPASPLIGVYEPGTPGGWSDITEFTGATGVKPRIVVYYSPWNDPFSTSFAQTAWGNDAYVLVQMQPNGVTLASIAAGGSDGYLRSYADAVVAFGHPVILSFGHEMNGTWYSWGYGHASPATFVAAWRHVVQVFRAEGAANVTWLWAAASEPQDRPRSRPAISPLTLAAAVSTPLPSYRALSPSRSSTASRDPVDAPEGTPARAVVPSASRTVTASVGRPRESRISSADRSATSNAAIVFSFRHAESAPARRGAAGPEGSLAWEQRPWLAAVMAADHEV